MISPSAFRELVSGRRRGPWASLLRAGLALVEMPYRAAVTYRNRRYDRDAWRTTRVDVPVVSVGNLTLGGTGKSPMVELLARWFLARNLRVAIVSRGYGAKPGHTNDEAAELAWKLPNVPHIQNPDRVAGAQAAIAQHQAQAIILDDGFQHRRLARQLDIVLLDALEPFGYDHVFPRGTLREPASGLRRANLVVLSRADLLNQQQKTSIRDRVLALNPSAGWIEAIHAPVGLMELSGQRTAIDAVRGQSVAAFCGIGNPAGFRHTLDTLGVRLAGLREFADHHRYTANEVADLQRWAAELGVDSLLCTMKDLVKLRGLSPGGGPDSLPVGVAKPQEAQRVCSYPLGASAPPVAAVEIALQCVCGSETLEAALASVVQP